MAFAQSSTGDSLWYPFNFFIGKWTGVSVSDGNNGTYERTYRYMFDGKFIEVKNKATFPATEKKPAGEVHEDIGYISRTVKSNPSGVKNSATFILRQFHSEGFINQYVPESISADGRKMIFITESIENIPSGWKARETYEVLSDNEFVETFELAAPGKDFTVYSKVKMTREITADVASDTVPRVTGIGGVFIVSDNPKETNAWYSTNLGFEIDRYGSVFEFRNANRPDEVNYLSWAIFRRNNSYLEPSKKEFMINYRVQNLEGMIREMLKNGITVLDTIETYDYGKFVHVMDLDGNKIELWEPIDSELSKIPRKTMK